MPTYANPYDQFDTPRRGNSDPYAGIGVPARGPWEAYQSQGPWNDYRSDPYAGIGAEVTDPELLRRLNAPGTSSNPFDQFDTPAANPLDHLPPPSANPLDSLPPPRDPSEYNPNSPAFQARYGPLANVAPDTAHPVTGEIAQGLRNARVGAGKFFTDAGLATQQMYANLMDRIYGPSLPSLITGTRSQALEREAAEKRAIDAPVMSTWGGRIGQALPLVPALAIPGVNTYAGAAALGGATGALQPTTEGQSRLLNTAVGAGTNLITNYIGNKLGDWILSRAAQPFMGWSQSTGNKVAAQAVGSDAARLDQPALAAAAQHFNEVFGAARSPNAITTLGTDSSRAITEAGSGLTASSADAFNGSRGVTDLAALVQQGGASAEQLGTISSNLGREASAQMITKSGDRQLGQALFALKDHVDDLVGATITDPELAAAYAAARPQYRVFSQLTSRPNLLNSSTGNVNLPALGKYLQRTDRQGYTLGNNQSPLYQAARWGQATGGGRGPPPFNLGEDLGLKLAGYYALNNPVSNAIGGVVSNSLRPVQPFITPGLNGLGVVATQTAVPYLTK